MHERYTAVPPYEKVSHSTEEPKEADEQDILKQTMRVHKTEMVVGTVPVSVCVVDTNSVGYQKVKQSSLARAVSSNFRDSSFGCNGIFPKG